MFIRMRSSCKFVLTTAALTLAAFAVTAKPVAAQEPKAELSAGYQFTHAAGDSGINFPAGWYLDVAGNVKPMFQVVGEVSGAYKTESDDFDEFGTDVSLKLHTFMGGIRVGSKANAKLVPFGQVLFGGARASGSVNASGGGTSINVGSSSTEFAMQLGAGVNAWVTNNFGIRIGADYRRILTGGGENEVRVVGGVVIPIR
jgi:opacity protein-like surface antigen